MTTFFMGHFDVENGIKLGARVFCNYKKQFFSTKKVSNICAARADASRLNFTTMTLADIVTITTSFNYNNTATT